MAKNMRQITLCVAEFSDPQTTELSWRRLADYFALPGRDPQFYVYTDDIEYLNIPNHVPTLGAIKLFSYPSDAVSSSPIDSVQVVTTIKPTVVLQPREMSEACLEDEDSVRQLLHSGFTIHKNFARAFTDGQVNLAAIIPSNTGRTRALFFNDKARLKLRPTDHKSFFLCTIESEPLNAKHYAEKVDIIDLENDNLIEYLYPRTTDGWTFLSKQPKLVKDTSLQLYTPAEYAPIYLKRCLALAPDKVKLQNDRKLTRNDITAILSYLDTAVKSETSIPEILKLTDEDVIAAVKSYLTKLIESLAADNNDNAGLISQMQAILWSSEKIRQDCIDKARADWMASKDPQRKAIEDLLASEKSIRESIGLAETELHELEDQQQAVKQETALIRSGLSAALESYQNDISKLLTQSGVHMTPLPIVTSGELMDNTQTEDNALTHNLSAYLPADDAEALATFIEEGICNGMHLMVSGHWAAWLANVLSISMSGMTASVIVRADPGCSTRSLCDAISALPTQTVLMQGVLTCCEDIVALTLARTAKHHTLVFSMDDPSFENKLSPCLYDHLLYIPDCMLDNIARPAQVDWQVNEHKLSSGLASALPLTWPIGPSEKFNKLAKEQESRRKGKIA